jgi:hypothetical protein
MQANQEIGTKHSPSQTRASFSFDECIGRSHCALAIERKEAGTRMKNTENLDYLLRSKAIDVQNSHLLYNC